MKYFILIFISLITLVIITSCGLIRTSSADKEKVRIAEEYGGIYVFDKKLRDEIIQREKEKKEYRGKYLGEYIQVGNETHFVDFTYLNNKFPQILSNGCKYFAKGLSVQEYERTDLSPYKEKIKEYTGEEAYNILHKGLSVSSYYVDKNNKVIPITFYTYIYDTITTYGLYGDEGAGFRLTNRYSVGIAGGNIFYLENGKFIKSDEIRKGERE
ncbi:hypothetical protein [Helicobacter fennelliae]|uniref:Lipoprotein n=1 Tax=Helicobacter fennelliae MRY12-0050 TaxID=1325130 RepID=T1DXC2_9HELI|nr:hypothetical protein [Helicobacter fennelliae]GAD20137.1 hypothetical protein HFN_1381 [Helicobacter fennelliae MRY12-0050]STP07403.1 Uncharacterised protein [Helicobacter fennelliae]